MKAPADHLAESVGLRCVRCGYDLRGQPAEGVCSECALPIADSARVAALPLRPPWARSDPRWRRRVLAGLWVLVLAPLPALLWEVKPAYDQEAPYGFWDAFNDYYEQSYATMVYAALVFCIGSVLIFPRERGCRPRRMDHVRRWGAMVPYLVLLTWIGAVARITLLVAAGIDKLVNPPGHPGLLQIAASSRAWSTWCYQASLLLALAVAVLAGIILRDAIIRSGAPRLARVVVVVGLGLIGVQLIIVLGYIAGVAWAEDFVSWEPFLNHYALAGGLIDWLLRALGEDVNVFETARYGALNTLEPLPGPYDYRGWASFLLGFPFEAAKWLLLLAIAVRLTAAQVRSWRHGGSEVS